MVRIDQEVRLLWHDGRRDAQEQHRALRRPLVTDPGASRVIRDLSAVHMPRAVMIFEGAGLTVVPSPTGHRARARRYSIRDRIVPDPARVEYSDAVMHELLGLLAVRLGLP